MQPRVLWAPDSRQLTMRPVIFLLGLAVACSAYRDDNPIQWLMDDLFEDQQYDATIIPRETGQGPIDLGLGTMVINMDMDDAGFLSANVWMNYKWTDYRLTWDPEQYRGIKQIRVPASMVWRPDIIIFNQVQKNEGKCE